VDRGVDEPQTERVTTTASVGSGEMVSASIRQFGAVLLLAALVAPAVAAPPPEPLCGPCSGFEAAAADEGVAVDLDRATATVTLARNGSAAWTVRLWVDETAAQTFAADPERRQAVATDALTGAGLPSVTEPVGLSTSVSGETVVLRFRDPDATDREAGLFVADFLRPNGQLTVDGADRVTLRGPPGTTLLVGRDTVTVADGGGSDDTASPVTLYDADTGPGDVSGLDESVLVFGPPDTVPGAPALAVAATVLPPRLDALERVGSPAVVVGVAFASILAVAVGWVGRRDWDATAAGRWLSALTVATTIPVVAVVVGGSFPAVLLAALGPYAVVGAAAWRRPAVFRSVVGTTAVTVTAALAAFAAAVVWRAGPIGAIQTVGRVAPVVLAPAVGAARRRLVAAGIGTAGAVVVVVSVVGPDTGGLAVVVTGFVVAAGLVFAGPPAAVAAAVSRPRPDEPS